MEYFTATPEWAGETVFVVAGGPSVNQVKPLDCLRGRKVIAINSSWKDAPFADILYFGDSRWWNLHAAVVLSEFKGRIITTAPNVPKNPRLLRMKKVLPPGLSDDRQALTMRRTSLTAALNLVKHLGVARIVLIGVDGKADPKGRTHHHKPHPWPQRPDCWAQQRIDLESTRKPLKMAGITVVHASPGSAYEFWPVVSLQQAITECLPPSA